MRYFISDLHFFHKLVHRKYRNHNATIDDMNSEIVYQWNKQVKQRDVVYILGDVTFGKFDETQGLVRRLNGQKVLIRGNHDERFSSKDWIEMGFHDVRDTLQIKLGDTKVILSHYPYSSVFKFMWYKYILRSPESNYYKFYLPFKGYWMIHGHHHSGPTYKPAQINVAWDINKKLLNEHDLTIHIKTTSITLWQKIKLILF